MHANEKSKLTNETSHKFTLKQFVWNGFNMTVGIPFLGSLALLANSSKDPDQPGYGLGLHIIWIFLLMGIVAYVCAYAFSKMSRYHKQDDNGGAYIFVRSAFGRFVGFLILSLNYIVIPLILSNQILMMIKANIDPQLSAAGNSEWWSDWTKHLGNWNYLTYDLIGLALAVVFILAAFFGAKTYKKISKYSLIVKWATSGFLIFFGIIAAALPVSQTNAQYWVNHTDFNFSHFLSAFCSCFYYFTGFEIFASGGTTVKEPEKNVNRGVVITMIFAVLFYIVMIIIFMLAQQSFTQNVSTGFWIFITNITKNTTYGHLFYWLIYAGPVIMIVSTVAMRGNIVSQTTLYAGATLQPMSTEGYISSNFTNLNTQGFPIKAMKLNIIICSFTVAVWSIIPDILVGFLGEKANFINVNTIISAASVFYIIIYFFILCAVIKYAVIGCIKNKLIEWILYPIVIVVLFVVLVDHFYDLFYQLLNSQSGEFTKNLAALIIELTFLFACLLFVVLTYFVYYKQKYNTRMATNPAKQKQLDYQFKTLDGWQFLKGHFYVSAIAFIGKRSKLVNNNYEDLSNPKFLANYKNMSDKFLKKSKNELMNYLKCSERIQKYNEQRGLDVKKEFFKNNQNAVKFLAELQKHINTNPNAFIYLRSINK